MGRAHVLLPIAVLAASVSFGWVYAQDASSSDGLAVANRARVLTRRRR